MKNAEAGVLCGAAFLSPHTHPSRFVEKKRHHDAMRGETDNDVER